MPLLSQGSHFEKRIVVERLNIDIDIESSKKIAANALAQTETLLKDGKVILASQFWNKEAAKTLTSGNCNKCDVPKRAGLPSFKNVQSAPVSKVGKGILFDTVEQRIIYNTIGSIRSLQKFLTIRATLPYDRRSEIAYEKMSDNRAISLPKWFGAAFVTLKALSCVTFLISISLDLLVMLGESTLSRFPYIE